MSEAALEEISVLAAIYCDPGECEVLSRSEHFPGSIVKHPGGLVQTLGGPLVFLDSSSMFGGKSQGLRSIVHVSKGTSPPSTVFLSSSPRDPLTGHDLRISHRTNTCESGITVMIQTNVRRMAESEIRLRLVFDLPVTYPSCLPNLSVSSEELTRAQCKELRDKLLDQARERLSEPMIHDLVLWTQQNFNSVIGNSFQDEKHLLSAVTDDGTWTTLLHLDHMRAKNKYVKTVEKWTSDLKLTGKLMFMGKIILILLQGDRSNIREYLILQKSCKVDVDSSGKRCKERMISVLCEIKLPPEHERFPTFEVKEYSSISELEKEFELAGLSRYSENM